MFSSFVVKSIPEAEHRYPTCGDWSKDFIAVTDLGRPANEKLVAIHEHVEKTICEELKINETEVTAFDMAYEETRSLGIAPCGCKHRDEPGDDLHAPYYRAHQVATNVERIVALELNLDWLDHNAEIEGEE